jgi:uncharacterized protein YndB with AHSA1/START domain
MEVDLRVGGTYRLSMHNTGGKEISVKGRFLTVKPQRLLVYTWQWEGGFDDIPSTTVRVAFRPTPGGTELELAQGPLELPHCCNHLHGWLGAFDRLRNTISFQASDHQKGAPLIGM